MDQKVIDELMKKPKEELVGMILKLDRKLFELVKELSKSDEYKGIVTDKNLNDFFAMKYNEER
ncbi:hypothetical protein KY328_04650 [Candidatus Woesearchaeota archaeon]|nr:hypothetical protein [Candidatus Woesearchaeota archaeon]MBW3022187.1 hypothetical protein [Candidatus Woesearchaeota archaeon]